VFPAFKPVRIAPKFALGKDVVEAGLSTRRGDSVETVGPFARGR
jgi:hypothetical protein